MLISMRKNNKTLKIILWIVIIAFAATIVVVWGFGSKQQELGYVAKVDGKAISNRDFKNYYDSVTQRIRSLGGQIDDNKLFTAAVLDELVNRELILKEADRVKLPVSNAEVVAQITNDPNFTINGVFDVEVYQSILNANRIAPAVYEESVREEIKMNKMLEMVSSAAAVQDQEIAIEYAFRNKQAAVSYFYVDPESMRAATVTDSADLEKFYQDNKEQFRVPAKIKLKYISVNDADFEFQSSITDEDVQARYTSAISQFHQPESADVRQIMTLVLNWDNAQEADRAKERIDKAYAALQGGQAFDTVAAEFSEDGNGGNIGRVARLGGDETEDKVFALQNGEYTEILKSDYGYHIYKIDNRTDAFLVPFSDVKDELRAAMIAEERSAAFRSKVYELYREISSIGNITAYLAKNPDMFEVGETELISSDDSFFAGDSDLISTLFAMGKTDVSPFMEYKGRMTMFEISDRHESYVPSLADINDEVVADYLDYITFRNALNAVDTAISVESMTNEEFASAAAGFNATITQVPAFKRDAVAEWVQELTDTIFLAEEGSVIKYASPLEGKIYVVRVAEIIMPDVADITEIDRNSLTAYLLSIKQQDAMKWFVKDLRDKAKIEINAAFLERN